MQVGKCFFLYFENYQILTLQIFGAGGVLVVPVEGAAGAEGVELDVLGAEQAGGGASRWLLLFRPPTLSSLLLLPPPPPSSSFLLLPPPLSFFSPHISLGLEEGRGW